MNNNVVGIIAEYNPFHNGHLWQIQKIKQDLADAPILVIMSGHFTQRGCPALIDKWTRAELAVLGGADLILELPFMAACKSAEYFARGAVRILAATSIVSHICFGTETHDREILGKLAQLTTRADFISNIKAELRTGISYAAATQAAMKNFFENTPIDILTPNNILAIEYLKALQSTNSNILPFAVPRQDAQHLDNEITGNIASATAIRKQIRTKGFDNQLLQTMPQTTSDRLLQMYRESNLLSSYTNFEKLLLYRLRQLEPQQMRQLADLSEGLENRVKKAAQNSSNLSELLDNTASRRYPQTRLMRVFCQLLVLSKNKNQYTFKPYFRVLAFNNIGRQLIKKIRPATVFPIITNLPDLYSQAEELGIKQSLDADINATDVYQILIGSNTAGLDFKKMPAYIDN